MLIECVKCARFVRTFCGEVSGDEWCSTCWLKAKSEGAKRCNADVDGCTAGPDGTPCATCDEERELSERAARRSWAVASPQERDPEKYARDLRDSGR